MNKCEWRDGKFESCENFDPDFIGVNQIVKCACCGETMWPKPEPAIITKKSGGTWVKRENGFDYYWPRSCSKQPEANSSFWQTFPDEITDEIAKLRPICIFGNMGYEVTGKLVYLNNWQEGFLSDKGDYFDYCRLATVADL